jgi:hypothetical protein
MAHYEPNSITIDASWRKASSKAEILAGTWVPEIQSVGGAKGLGFAALAVQFLFS